MNISPDTFKSINAYVPRNGDITVDMQELMDEQIEVILNHRATNHPFLVSYGKNGASIEASKILYLETLHYFKYLPFYVCGISTITRDEAVLRAITFNASDELGQTKSHADIYRDFFKKKGITEHDIEAYVCLPGTRSLNDGIRAMYSTPPLQKALGGLFADEAMSASMVSRYNDGLIQEGLCLHERRFWTLHMDVEVGHSNAIFNIMEKHLQTNLERNLFKEGIGQYLHLMEIYWDGIEQKVGRL